ncbi:metallophosphoesterase [Virgibacillus sp. C22-A2]|uniref:Metallophosphoesterase n=1 Tax=Virgibacillus tibetensis TaxID=3042313 RepID=A0ABU6KAT3_9BACI|nr:metallophosphoesterase [Virgibacillus sp. C22-A2]
MVRFIIRMSVSLLLLSFYMFYLAHRDTINYKTIYDKRLPDNFTGFRIFFILDIHTRTIEEATLKSIKNSIDIVIIGGDLTEKGVPLERTRENIQKLAKWNVPIYFIWGNNDYESSPDKLYSLLIKENVTVLTNESRDISANGQVISLLGLDCSRHREARIDLAKENAKGDYFILVTHDPNSFDEMDKEDQYGIHTVLSGHTHGGQIRLMGYGPYEKGSFQKDGYTIKLISEGYGYTWLPFRLGTKSECHVITFMHDVYDHSEQG